MASRPMPPLEAVTSGPDLRTTWASIKEMNANFHHDYEVGQRNVLMATAPLGLLCLDCFSFPCLHNFCHVWQWSMSHA